MPKSCAAALVTLGLLLASLQALAGPVQDGCAPEGGAAEDVGSLQGEDGFLVLADGRRTRLAGLDAASVRLPVPLDATGGSWRLTAVGPPDRHGVLPVELRDGAGSLALRLVAAGAARVRPRPGEPACFPALLAAEARARQASLGLWRDPGYAVADASDEAAVGRMLGRFSILQGRVRHVGTSRERIFLDFGPVWRTDVTLMLQTRDLPRFRAAGIDPPALEGRLLRVRGVPTDRGGPALLVGEPAAVEILDCQASGGSGPAAP